MAEKSEHVNAVLNEDMIELCVAEVLERVSDCDFNTALSVESCVNNPLAALQAVGSELVGSFSKSEEACLSVDSESFADRLKLGLSKLIYKLDFGCDFEVEFLAMSATERSAQFGANFLKVEVNFT
ncbi:hypothetical protein [Aliivibrio salmonicida]|uniref:hypothetical protein n=1 Tax=Aliivibrio salmonicida TaxID=40269 RepID=UPI003D0C6AED